MTGVLPQSLGVLSSLQILQLQFGKIGGTLPSSIGKLKNAFYICLTDHEVEGPIPASIANMTKLIKLTFEFNPKLQFLYINHNNLLGEVPSFSSNHNLQNVKIQFNNLSGHLPPFPSNPNLQGLDVSNNNLSGPLPSFTSNTNLQNLHIQNNRLSAPPSPDFSNIVAVILSSNANLKGTLPTVLSTPSLTNIVIEGCSFSGPLPTTITSPLLTLYLAGNSFTSSIPPLPSTILDVSLAYNQITSSIPPSFFSNTPNLKTFDVRHNKIGGSIPTFLSNLTNLADLKLDLNAFSGALPSDISTWPIFENDDASTTVLFGNIWSCPVPDSVREHSEDDPNHAYSCGGSEFVNPAILAAAAGALFVIAASFTKQFKSTLLNELWVAKASMKLINPKKCFNYLVFTMSVLMLLNALVVPSVLILLLDERCFKYLLCGSAVIQAYSPVVTLEILFGGFLQPALWWLCIDGGKSHIVKWTVLVIGLFMSFGLPQIVGLFAEDLDGGKILPGGWALGQTSAGVFMIVFLVGWGTTNEAEGEGGETVQEEEESKWFYLPPVDYLLEAFDYNSDEKRLFEQKNYTWPLQERGSEVVMEKFRKVMDRVGFVKGNFDGS
ncbi:hypothetical protein TrLO_g10569 [Triparma laevis f. longispina]|uniref:Uncharacterized protein n=1 Tax=Triparma laevis f. longispina TaxID=1714387 RepID=A0A9W7L0I1_9STRA|nr:hypothetical protein TrLO_g10569 [Triparma laevis f. longispina]